MITRRGEWVIVNDGVETGHGGVHTSRMDERVA